MDSVGHSWAKDMVERGRGMYCNGHMSNDYLTLFIMIIISNLIFLTTILLPWPLWMCSAVVHCETPNWQIRLSDAETHVSQYITAQILQGRTNETNLGRRAGKHMSASHVPTQGTQLLVGSSQNLLYPALRGPAWPASQLTRSFKVCKHSYVIL